MGKIIPEQAAGEPDGSHPEEVEEALQIGG
jgi:hypothetical protein